MTTIKDTLILEDRMSQTIRAVQTALDHASASTKIAKVEMEQLKKTYGETSIECANATMKWSQQAQKVEKLQDKLENLNKTSNKSTAFMMALGGIGANLAMRAFDGLKNSIAGSIELASKLQEVQNVTDTVFENNAKVIDDWSKTAIKSFGLSELQAKEFTGTIGSMLKAMGVGGNDLSNMSMSLAGLAGDIASFKNLAPEEAFNKLRAGIAGETEPLKAIGVIMNDVNLKQFAMEKGIKKSYSAMTQAEKAMLRYEYILKNTSFMQGDFSKTMLSYANQQRIFTNNQQELGKTLATYVLPALTTMYRIANSFIEFLVNTAIPALEYIMPVITGIAGALGIIYVGQAIKAIKTTFELAKVTKFFGDMALISWIKALGPIGWIAVGVGVVIGVMVVLVNKCKPVAEVFYKIANAIDGAFTAFKKWRNRGDEKMVAKIEADYQARVNARAERVANIGNKSSNSANKANNPLAKALNGNAINTKQQGAIELKEEDIKMLNELASRDFMVRYQSLSPQVTFGNVTVNETADFNQVLGQLDTWVEEKANNSLNVGVGK